MNKFLLFLAIIFFGLCSCSQKENQSVKLELDISKNEKRKFTLPDSEIFPIKSNHTNKEYDIYVKLPKGHGKTDKKYPILVLTDAGYAFPLVSSIYRRLKFSKNINEIIIVGISYAKGEHFGISRTRDYTPTYSPNESNGYSKEARLSSGQADSFIMFMKNELIPYLDSNYSLDMNKKVFAGHSLGGLLANYIVLSYPETFDYYISGSPSFWYHNKSIFKIEEEFHRNNTDLKTNLFMGIGALEDIEGGHQMVSDMKDFENKLINRNYKSLNLQSMVFPNENHQTVYPTFITKGMLWAFKKE
ncbi:alpha/beta hydrolase-fold protein [uncultured Croceitalea sp.]|uniref:alpha/beta hydrolase n=1 Tax=uncultured Croceitalea sp. TaxID=1798908 RepID=UPI0033065BF3